jgi:hypothetical protein
MTPGEAWLYRMRARWAAQLILSKVHSGQPDPPVDLAEVLRWALIRSWETDGCLAFWSHAERDGAPHPDNPEGLTPWPAE